MKKESEKVIERKLVDLVKQSGGMCIKLLSTHLTGLPDRMCLLPGSKITFVELKSTGEKPRPSQVYIHKKLRALGFNVEVVDTIQGVYDLIKKLKEL